jgi:hypothetical protein
VDIQKETQKRQKPIQDAARAAEMSEEEVALEKLKEHAAGEAKR